VWRSSVHAQLYGFCPIIREVEQFLYREARLLDERRFHEWLLLFTEDVRYWMPVRSNRYPKSSKAIKILDPDRYRRG
jgi:3-phenylpropionate/cinnamic acid dioxygenase small subunit